MSQLFQIERKHSSEFAPDYQVPLYSIFLFEGNGTFSVDLTSYHFSGKTILFLSPHQHFKWIEPPKSEVRSVLFHGDFYCIEYHKKEVACNGLLFNAIYLIPHIDVSAETYQEICSIIGKIEPLHHSKNEDNEAIIRTYLQLILALSSKEKKELLEEVSLKAPAHDEIVDFQNQLEIHFLQTRELAFYASAAGLTVSAFSRKIKKHFGKTPSKLIQERIILESKKLLHLTNKPIKEIASILKFEDEFYFSRYFKKAVGVSPKNYRETVGISIVAK
ncbi:HTH-type transcriptional activator Btr [compost metagenome]